jgi:hypothetical protein
MLTIVTIFGVRASRHYLIVAAPMMALWAAQTVLWSDPRPVGKRARRTLTAFAICEAGIAFGLLGYIHATQIIRWEYGRSQESHCASLDHTRHSDCLRSLVGSR